MTGNICVYLEHTAVLKIIQPDGVTDNSWTIGYFTWKSGRKSDKIYYSRYVLEEPHSDTLEVDV